ncbi:PREDICTED: tetraspanin-32 [Ceratotherium simum simum]|uniref:Tetraspanin n=1 Tax=Ceratotherium simum simum TaxID=73337 RepID=A0ABM1DHM7_CERSS|nr:PREDICTED: tetraspanin-32 [Ceratotherium simum simum]
MGPWSRVSVAKCQMLVTSLFVLLLGLAVATMAALTYFGAHFVVIGRASSERTSYEARHRWAFYVGISLAGLLTLGAVLTAVATVREAGGLMAGGFLCFALVFCALVQVAFWRLRNPAQVEDAVLDTYDLVYDHAVKSSSGVWRQELVAIQDMFLCCGKGSPFSLLGSSEADLCRGAEAARQDCLQGIGRFLSTHRNIIFTLTSIGLASMVYAMLLSSFLWFAIRSGRSLDHKGRYTLNPR